jgi:hypothetical protein
MGLSNHREPILTFGAKNRGQIVFVHFEDGGRGRMGLSDSLGRESEGIEFPIRPGGLASISVHLPALNALAIQPNSFALGGPSGLASVFVDGRKVFEAAAGDIIAGPRALSVGKNAMQAPGISDSFLGGIRIAGGMEGPDNPNH